MATKFKDTPKRGVGRPENSTMTERQALIKRELIATLKPYYKPAAEQLAILAGIDISKLKVKSDKASNELVIEDESKDSKKESLISPTIRVQACRALMDSFTEAIKDLYSKEDYTPAKAPEEEEDKPKQTATVSKLSLHVKTTEQ